METLRLLWGTVLYRPYVYAFFACFLAFAIRHLGATRTAAYTGVSFAIAFAAEFSSTRNGFPFGAYRYFDATRARELWISNVPFWDSLSFVFLSYFSWLTAAFVLKPADVRGALTAKRSAVAGGFLMMILDIVIDPLTLRGDRWFLGRIYFYPHPGPYFGVTLTNFAGWWIVGSAILLVTQRLARGRRPPTRQGSWSAFAVYAGVLAFNLAITGWIRAWALFGASSAVALVTIALCLRKIHEGGWSAKGAKLAAAR